MDDESENLHWNAMNYLTAATQYAEEMWQALEECVKRKVAEERERCARICEETWVEPGDLQTCNCQEAADKIRKA